MRGTAAILCSVALATISCGGNGSSKPTRTESAPATVIIDSQTQLARSTTAPADTGAAGSSGTSPDTSGAFGYAGPRRNSSGDHEPSVAGTSDTGRSIVSPGRPGTSDTSSMPAGTAPGVSDTAQARTAGLHTRSGAAFPGSALRARSAVPTTSPPRTDSRRGTSKRPSPFPR